LLNRPVNFGAIVCAGTPSSASAARISSNSGGVCGLSVSSIETSVMNVCAPFAASILR
jgi:hypothetical protein